MNTSPYYLLHFGFCGCDLKLTKARQAYGGVKPFVPEVSLDVLLARPIEQWQGVVKNDFEAHIFKSHPLLGNLKQQLLDAGAIYASMSGSGSALFGIFDCRPEINFDSTIFTHIEQL